VPVQVASCASGPQPNGAFHEVWTYDGERRLLTPYRRFGALDTDGGETRRGTALLSQDAASAVMRWNFGSVSWVGLGGLCLAPAPSGSVELTTCERARWSVRPAPREAGPARYVLATRHAGREQCLSSGEGGSLRLASCEATATQQHFAWIGRQLVASSNACVATRAARPTRGAPVTLGSCEAAAGRATLATHWHLRGPLRTESRSCVAGGTGGDQLMLAACGRAHVWEFHL
jgi:hypothetical protein